MHESTASPTTKQDESWPRKATVGRGAYTQIATVCRQSFASHSFARCADAGRVAGYCGNSAAMIHRHYRQLAIPTDAKEFFNVKPAQDAIALPKLVTAN
jgi:hypothetical protein